jgi:hypothetical protein
MSANQNIVNLESFESNYQILGILGEGAHAVVKRCKNVKDGKEYAVKIIRNGDEEIIIQV